MRKTSRFPGPDSLQWGDRGKLMFVTPATQRAKTKAEINNNSAIIAQRLSEFETYHLRSQERLDVLTVFGSRKIISLSRTGKTIEKFSQPLLCAALLDQLRQELTSSGRMSRQYVYNRSVCDILNNGFNQ